jgi:FkbM family methyltransferase
MNEPTKRFLKRMVKSMGYSITTKENVIDLFETLISLKEAHSISVVYDIGANKGKYGSTFFRNVFPKSRIYAFEANRIHFPYPRGLYDAEFQVCLSNNDHSDVNFFSNNSTGDSVFREATDYYAEIKPTNLRTRTLDSICVEKGIPRPDLMKLDVQGSEMLVLEGATNILNDTKFLIIEMSLIEYNIGAPTFDDLILFLTKLGFFPISILEQHKVESVIVQLDLLFEKRHRPF